MVGGCESVRWVSGVRGTCDGVRETGGDGLVQQSVHESCTDTPPTETGGCSGDTRPDLGRGTESLTELGDTQCRDKSTLELEVDSLRHPTEIGGGAQVTHRGGETSTGDRKVRRASNSTTAHTQPRLRSGRVRAGEREEPSPTWNATQ